MFCAMESLAHTTVYIYQYMNAVTRKTPKLTLEETNIIPYTVAIT